MTRFAERFMEKGRLEGREEGRKEGRLEGRVEGREEGIGQGEARILLRLLTLKFGPVPEPVRSRVESADAETMLRWSEQVLSADRLEDVVAG